MSSSQKFKDEIRFQGNSEVSEVIVAFAATSSGEDLITLTNTNPRSDSVFSLAGFFLFPFVISPHKLLGVFFFFVLFCFFVPPACVSSPPRSHRGEDQIFQFARRAPSENPSNDTHQKPFCTCFRPANVNACKSNQPPAGSLLSRPCAFIPMSKAPRLYRRHWSAVLREAVSRRLALGEPRREQLPFHPGFSIYDRHKKSNQPQKIGA